MTATSSDDEGRAVGPEGAGRGRRDLLPRERARDGERGDERHEAAEEQGDACRGAVEKFVAP